MLLCLFEEEGKGRECGGREEKKGGIGRNGWKKRWEIQGGLGKNGERDMAGGGRGRESEGNGIGRNGWKKGREMQGDQEKGRDGEGKEREWWKG